LSAGEKTLYKICCTVKAKHGIKFRFKKKKGLYNMEKEHKRMELPKELEPTKAEIVEIRAFQIEDMPDGTVREKLATMSDEQIKQNVISNFRDTYNYIFGETSNQLPNLVVTLRKLYSECKSIEEQKIFLSLAGQKIFAKEIASLLQVSEEQYDEEMQNNNEAGYNSPATTKEESKVLKEMMRKINSL